MRWPSDIPDAEIDRLLAGHKPEDSGLDGVAQFLGEVDSAIPEEPTTALETAHLTAMVQTAHALAENGGFAEQPLDPALALHARRGHVFAFRNLAAHKWASAAVLSAMGLLAFGGAAYAGVLPAPVQEATSELVQQVGISIPKTHTSNLAGNNGVRDHGAGIGRGKGQGGIRRELNNAEQGQVSATGTVETDHIKKDKARAAAAVRAQKANAKRHAAKARASAKAKARAKAKAKAKTHKRVSAKKKSKVKKASSSSPGKKSSAAETDRETGKGH